MQPVCQKIIELFSFVGVSVVLAAISRNVKQPKNMHIQIYKTDSSGQWIFRYNFYHSNALSNQNCKSRQLAYQI
jgi:hypothetical protein